MWGKIYATKLTHTITLVLQKFIIRQTVSKQGNVHAQSII